MAMEVTLIQSGRKNACSAQHPSLVVHASIVAVRSPPERASANAVATTRRWCCWPRTGAARGGPERVQRAGEGFQT
jgi:hypothetical protein